MPTLVVISKIIRKKTREEFMKKPVIAIGLDAASPVLIEKWIEQGYLPNLSRLKEQGAYTRLKTNDRYKAETTWTSFLTGCSPDKTGCWGQIQFQNGSYEVEEIGPFYDFVEYQPFYALGDNYRVAVFDMPQTTLCDRVNGMQILGWGAHAPMTPSHSQPPELLGELTKKYGNHPAFNKDHADTLNKDALFQLQKALENGISRRSAICQDLLQREKWDLFLTIFGETHAAEHFLWHQSQKDHPLYGLVESVEDDPLLKVFEAVDRAVGEILAVAPEDACILVFAAHGMGANTMDLPGMLFLPELLYRWSFGKAAIAPGKIGTAPGKPLSAYKKRGWYGQVWSMQSDSNPLRSFLRRELPTSIFQRLEKFLGKPQETGLDSPYELRNRGDKLWWQSARWYQPLWHQMKAFALPTYSEGRIRINLQGREPQGIVTPSEYTAVCDEIEQFLSRLKDGRTGKLMVKDVIRTRHSALDQNPKLPPADLIVCWQEDDPTDVIDSPDFGRIGPVPHHRTGSHLQDGFLMIKGANVEFGDRLPDVHNLDLAPTILELMGAKVPTYFDGKSLVSTKASVSLS